MEQNKKINTTGPSLDKTTPEPSRIVKVYAIV
ncbi:hypothetical protein HNR33_001965 [Brassicibacter mesophilus]